MNTQKHIILFLTLCVIVNAFKATGDLRKGKVENKEAMRTLMQANLKGVETISQVFTSVKNIIDNIGNPIILPGAINGLGSSLLALANDGVNRLKTMSGCMSQEKSGRITQMFTGIMKLPPNIITRQADGILECLLNLQDYKILGLDGLFVQLDRALSGINQNILAQPSFLEVDVKDSCDTRVPQNLRIATGILIVSEIFGDCFKLIAHAIKGALSIVAMFRGGNIEAATFGGGFSIDLSKLMWLVEAPFNLIQDVVRIVVKNILADLRIYCFPSKDQMDEWFSIASQANGYNIGLSG